MLKIKNVYLDKIRTNCIQDVDFDEVIETFTAKDFNHDLLLKLIDQNESMCFEINQDLCSRVFGRLKQSKFLDLAKMDLTTEEFVHVL